MIHLSPEATADMHSMMARYHADQASAAQRDAMAAIQARQDHETDIARQKAWNAQRDAYVVAGDWWNVARMDA